MSDNGNPLSRRQIVGGAGLGMAAMVAAAPASAQETTAAVMPKPLEDPTTKYPRPPYPRQSQPWPGLAGKMDPKPDHGETSYKGSGRLLGRKALITGGDSGMGRAAAIAFAREGSDVAINYLPDEEPDAREVVALIRAAGRKAVALPGDLRDASFCRRLVEDAVRELGVRSRDEVTRIDPELARVCFPSVCDGLERCFPPQCLEVLGEVVGPDEREDVRLEAVEIRVVEDFERRVLDGAVHPLCLAVGPGVVGLGQLVSNAVFLACPPEDMQADIETVWAGPVFRQIGKSNAVVR